MPAIREKVRSSVVGRRLSVVGGPSSVVGGRPSSPHFLSDHYQTRRLFYIVIPKIVISENFFYL